MTNRNSRTTRGAHVQSLDRPDSCGLSPRKAMALLGSVVYAVEFPDGVIKFGCTTALHHRLDELKWAKGQVPRLVGFRLGDFADEQALHQSLREHRIEGRREFYHPTEPVRAVVAEMREKLGLPPI